MFEATRRCLEVRWSGAMTQNTGFGSAASRIRAESPGNLHHQMTGKEVTGSSFRRHGRSWDVAQARGLALAVGVFAAETTVVEDELATLDVIANPEATETKPVLATLSGRDARELQEIVLGAPVIWVGSEHVQSVSMDAGKFWMLSVEASQQAIELGDGADRKRRCHDR